MSDTAGRASSRTFRWRLAGAVRHLRTRWKYRGSQPIVVVHQMGRVGSKTVRWAVRDDVPGVRSLHTHYLNPRTIEHMHEKFVRMYRHTGQPVVYREHAQSCWLAEKIERRDYGDWKVVSLVRDPIARTVSAFFRHLPLHHPEVAGRFADDPGNVAKLIELFRGGDHFESGFALDWFDREVRDVFGVDVFERPFPADGMGCVYPCDAGSVLVLRTEDLASSGSEALGAFLGTGPIGLKHHNRTVERSYARTYERFMSELRLSPDYLDRMYGSRLARHFYREDEIAAFRHRWQVDA